MAERKFIRAETGKYSMEEKEALGKLCKQYKHESDGKAAELSKKVINCNDKIKKHTKPIPRKVYIARDVRDFYLDLRNVRHNDPNLKAAVKLVTNTNAITNNYSIVKAPPKSMLHHQSLNTVNHGQGEEQPYLT